MADDPMEAEWAAALQEQRTSEQPETDQTDDTAQDGWEAALNENQQSGQSAEPEQEAGVDWAAALEEQRHEIQQPAASDTQQKVNLSVKGMDRLLKIPLYVSVVLGDTRMLINDLLQLGQGSIIELNKMAGRRMDLFVNGTLLGRGEVVVINEHFGVKIAQIVSPEERIKSLA
jgi:flagellar motor switch protein FliN